MEKLTDSELMELSKSSMRRTMKEIHDCCSSVILLNLKWKDMESVLDAAQRSVEEQREELKLKEEEFGLKEKAFEKQCRDFELEQKDLEQSRKDLGISKKQCEEQCKEVKSMEKLVNDKLKEVGLKERDLEKCLRDYKLKEEQFGLKEKSFEKRFMEFELEVKASKEQLRDLEFTVKQREGEVKSLEKLAKDKLEEVGLKEKYLEKCLREYESKEERFGLKEKSFKKRFMEFELEETASEECLRDLEFSVKQREDEVKSVEKLVKDKLEEVGLKEKDLEKCLREYELKEEQFGLKEKNFEKRFKEFELDEKASKQCLRDLEFSVKQREDEVKSVEKLVKDKLEEVGLKEKDLEKCLWEYESKEEQYGLKEKSFQKRIMEFELKEKAVKERCNTLEIDAKQNEHELKRLEATEKLVQKQLEEIERKEEEFVQRCKDVELKKKSLELCYQVVQAKEEHHDECLRKVKLREKEIEELSAEQRRKYEQQSSDLEFDVKNCDKRFKGLESKEKELADGSKELEMKRGLDSALHPRVKTDAAGFLSVKYSIDHSSQAHPRLCVNMDGKNLQMFLNEHWKDHGSIGTKVAMALQRSADPAKLVLDAMEGFYPPHLRKGYIEFEGKVARRSCILMLEQLMELSPEIKPHVREKAIKLAFDWITKMRVESGHELEVLGFLWLLASFRLTGSFDADNLFGVLVFVAREIQNTEIFKALGFKDENHYSLKKLVRSEQHMRIIRYMYALGLREEPHKQSREFIATETPSKRLKGSKQEVMDEESNAALKDSDVGSNQVPESNGKEWGSKSFVEVGNDPDVKTSKKLISKAWQYFDLFMENGIRRAKCKSCKKTIACVASSGTSHLLRHATKTCSNRACSNVLAKLDG